MKLSSTIVKGKQLVCENAIFDPGLITNVEYFKDEQTACLEYDFSESGNPLDLPNGIMSAVIFVKITPYDLHVEVHLDVDDDFDTKYECLLDSMFGLTLTARLDDSEKQKLLLFLVNKLPYLTTYR